MIWPYKWAVNHTVKYSEDADRNNEAIFTMFLWERNEMVHYSGHDVYVSETTNRPEAQTSYRNGGRCTRLFVRVERQTTVSECCYPNQSYP